MKKAERRRILISRILLAVFVPMLLLSALHIHTEETSADDSCIECMHHVRHSHLTSGNFCIGQCVLCQFQTLPFIIAALTTICITLMVRQEVRSTTHIFFPVSAINQQKLRAPPAVDVLL